jgi:Metal-dependent hydrolases of the beta-lactamase superfamily III
MDHIFGVIWVIRKIVTIAMKGEYKGKCNIYCNDDVADAIKKIAKLCLRKIMYETALESININIVEDKEEVRILDYDVTFYNINGQSDKQFGFYTKLTNGKKLVFCGDEPFRPQNVDLDFTGYDYMFHEAFCTEKEAHIFKPYEKDHATANSAAVVAQKLAIKNLILWHTEDKDIPNRREKYVEDSKSAFDGNVIVPNDLEIIKLN